MNLCSDPLHKKNSRKKEQKAKEKQLSNTTKKFPRIEDSKCLDWKGHQFFSKTKMAHMEIENENNIEIINFFFPKKVTQKYSGILTVFDFHGH